MQFDVFPNPLARARRAFPYVVVLQADVGAAGPDRIIAFLAPKEHFGAVAGRLMPVVRLKRQELVLLMPSLTNVPASDLRGPVGNIAGFHDQIVGALDWMFLDI